MRRTEWGLRLVAMMLACCTLLLTACDSGEEGEKSGQSDDGIVANDSTGGGERDVPRSRNIIVEGPKPNATLAPERFVLSGSARTFEGNVLYRLIYDSVIVAAKGFTTASANEPGTFGPFSVPIEYSLEWGGPGVLEVYEEDAATGSETNVVRIPIRFPGPGAGGKGDKQIYVYFSNNAFRDVSETDGHRDCRSVFPLKRALPVGSTAAARWALYQLFSGPTAEEYKSGYRTEIPAGTRLERLTIVDGLARVECNGGLNRIPHECEIETVRAQIEQTLAQFESVNAVAITVQSSTWATGR